MPRALITGITGQDGSYLAELLLDKGYEVHGVVRRTSSPERSWLGALFRNPEIIQRRLFFHYADLEDATTLRRILTKIRPDEIYHLAGQTSAALSFEIPEATAETIGMGTLRLLEIIRDLPGTPRLFHASSSEIFGRPEVTPQDERTPFRPVTPYGCAKAFATQMVSVYRQAHHLFACNGILFNHESPRRGANFVTQKICSAAAAIKQGRQKELRMGSLTTRRDWGDARDYVRGMWLMLQQQKPDDFVLATGQLHSVKDLVEIAFGVVELGWEKYVIEDTKFLRPDEPAPLIGNPKKAKEVLQWQSTTRFEQLIREMTQAALNQPETGS
jgi:GDPmannose 4,6-dehydratase